jgi:hypothetical protein
MLGVDSTEVRAYDDAVFPPHNVTRSSLRLHEDDSHPPPHPLADCVRKWDMTPTTVPDGLTMYAPFAIDLATSRTTVGTSIRKRNPLEVPEEPETTNVHAMSKYTKGGMKLNMLLYAPLLKILQTLQDMQMPIQSLCTTLQTL